MRTSTDNGDSWGEELTVADVPNLDDRDPDALLWNNNGTENILVVYCEQDWSIFNTAYAKISTDLGMTWSKKIALSGSNKRANNRATHGNPIDPMLYISRRGCYLAAIFCPGRQERL